MRFPRELVLRAFTQTCDRALDERRAYAVVPVECLQDLEPGDGLPVRLDLCGAEGRADDLVVNFICLLERNHDSLHGWETPEVLQYAL